MPQERECPICGTTFKAKKKGDRTQTYCSLPCANQGGRGMPRAGSHYRIQHMAGDDRWMRRAKCRGYDPEIWFGPTVVVAKRICARCPVTAECLEYALRCETDAYVKYGVFGGVGPEDRGKLAKIRRVTNMGSAREC